MSSDLASVPLAPWWRSPQRGDRWAVATLVGIPLVLFILPALVGHPAIDADNLIQNFPLRVLAGRQLASGHLPLLNPLTNAGTPLLGGLNAGALYPLTLIFAFIPPITAWIINMIVVYVSAGVGMFALLRWHGARTTPALVAGVSYTYCGAMIGQMIHLGVIQGYSFVPWAVLIMLALSRRLAAVPDGTSVLSLARIGLPWVLGEGALWGLTFLSGEPRAMATMELLTIVVIPCVLILRSSYWLATWRTRITYLLTLVVGFAWGLGIGLVQLLPGWSFIKDSERSDVGYSFFGAGSLAVHWSALLFTPDLFGGNGAFGQTGFFANYNLAEVTGYVGVVALVATAAFFTRLTLRGWRGAERDYAMYVVLLVVGLLATWGSFTPLGHLFRAIPLYGSTRLQSRSVILVDFVASVFVGWWLQHILDGRPELAGLGKRSRWVTAAPAIFIVVLSGGLIGWGPWVIKRIGIQGGNPALETGLKLTNAIHLAIALVAALAIVLFARHARRLVPILMAVLVADLVVFLLFTSNGLIGGQGAREASRAYAEQLISSNGRFAMVDVNGAHTKVFRDLGQPNMNVFTHMASVQGYGALVSNIYDNATGTHPQAWLNACHLQEGIFTPLRLAVVVIASGELMTPTNEQSTVPTRCEGVSPAPSVPRYFGQALSVGSISLAGVNGRAISSSPITVRLLTSAGKTLKEPSWTLPGDASTLTVQANDATKRAAGFVVSSASGVSLGDAVVTPWNSSKSYRLDSHFQLAIATSKWHLTSTQDTFSVFKAAKLLPRAWLLTPSAGTVTHIRTAIWGDAWVSVALTKPSALDRSEAYLPGWRATAVNQTTGKVVQLNVERTGLIEKVRVPTGKWIIHFHYRAPYIEISVAASVIAGLAWLGVLSWLLVSARRRRPGKVQS